MKRDQGSDSIDRLPARQIITAESIPRLRARQIITAESVGNQNARRTSRLLDSDQDNLGQIKQYPLT